VRKLQVENRESRGLQFRIEVDGGVHHDTVASIVRAGTQILVAGSAIFENAPYSKTGISGNLGDKSSDLRGQTGRFLVFCRPLKRYPYRLAILNRMIHRKTFRLSPLSSPLSALNIAHTFPLYPEFPVPYPELERPVVVFRHRNNRGAREVRIFQAYPGKQ
jgi:hypothetical protein